MIPSPSDLGADVIEAASGHASVPLAAFGSADCLGLTREDCGVCAKFASFILQA